MRHGHSEVWGSWYDAQQRRWGYACCRCVEHNGACTAAPDDSGNGGPCSRDDALTASSSGAAGPAPVADTGLEELPPREHFGADAVGYIIHWVRAVLHEWQARLRGQDPQVLAHPRFGTQDHFGEAEKVVALLVQVLEACSSNFWVGEAVHVWSVGNKKWMKDGKVVDVLKADTVVAGSKTPADGTQLPAGSVLVAFSAGGSKKWVTPGRLEASLRKARKVAMSNGTISKLEQIAVLSASRDYHAADQAYIELTVGHGRWHENLSFAGMTGCNKAPRNGFTVNRDQSNVLDTEEAKECIFCVKRLLALLQLIRPSS